MLRNLQARIAVALLLLAVSASSHSAFHLWVINEVYSNADGTLQFIELSTTFGSQQFLAGAAISSTQGATTNTFTFPNNLVGDSANKKFLIGTAGIAAAGGPAPDYIMPNGFIFTTNVAINFSGGASVTYPSIPTDGTLSIDAFGSTATNSPTNYAGATGTVVAPNPGTAPGAPIIGTATPGNGQAAIAFTAGPDGGSAITSFTATCTSSGQTTRTGTGSASPITVTALTNGLVYSCSVTATNARGTGPASGAVNVMPSAPATVPDAPTIISASAGNMQSTITFAAPINNGGAMITNYIVTCGAAVASGPTSPITIMGLPNNVTVACTVAAVNSAGTGAQSAPINVTAMPNATAPGAPVITSAVAGDQQATISFVPGSDGGSQVTQFNVSCAAAGQATRSFSGSLTTVTLSPLVNGVNYSCTVSATNGVGPGPASAVNVTPAAPITAPGAPTINSAKAGVGQATITFTAPANNGGAAITSYVVTCGNRSASGAASPLIVTGLTNGTTYACAVAAVNSAGTGQQSASLNVTPRITAVGPLFFLFDD